MQGTVKFFDPNRGWGFIAPDDGNGDVFVHHSAILMDGFRTLTEGARVEYATMPGRKGPSSKQAVNVVVIG